MFDIGWTELLVVGVVALIVVGPKDLPKMFRALGQFTAKARNMAREFQRAMDAAADETGVKDVASDLRKATSAQEMGLDELRDLNRPEKWAPKGKRSAGTAKDTPSTAAASDPSADPAGEAAADSELDVVAREMDRLRAERAEARSRPPGVTAEPPDPSGPDVAASDSPAPKSARSPEGSGT